MEPYEQDSHTPHFVVSEALVDEGESPFDSAAHEEVRARVEEELGRIPEPYRSTVILRDLEDMSYEEIAEVLDVSLGTVKSRLTRGREALRRRLAGYVREVGPELGLVCPEESVSNQGYEVSGAGEGLEVTS
jgi:RNA polymerase sigma-70 factor (ECF subfamily)